ncbi:DUF6463 family protein [Kribbella sp. NPDC003505]|uniref:DUF6463 family protein n=1 Tax=Kribbella sp. NPDC003505 TaxID=3154448 RepID=UPI0033BC56B4
MRIRCALSRMAKFGRAGAWTVVVGVLHLVMTEATYPGGVRLLLRSIPGFGDSGAKSDLWAAGFWYVTAGIFLIGFGLLLHAIERAHGATPRGVATLMIVVGAWDVLMNPVSGFWHFFAVAWRARINRAERGSSSGVRAHGGQSGDSCRL